jgi:hypothetical protein
MIPSAWNHGGGVKQTETTKEKLRDYGIGAAAGLAGVLVGLSKGVTLLVLIVGYAVAFFAPYQIRRLIRRWKRARS